MVRWFIVLIVLTIPFFGFSQIGNARIKSPSEIRLTKEISVQTYSDSGSWYTHEILETRTLGLKRNKLIFYERIDTFWDYQFGCEPNFRETLSRDSGFYVNQCDTFGDTCTVCTYILGFVTTRTLQYKFYTRHDTIFFKEIVSDLEYPALVLNLNEFKAHAFLPNHYVHLFYRYRDSTLLNGEKPIEVYRAVSYYGHSNPKVDTRGAIEGEKECEILISKETLLPVRITYYWYERGFYNSVIFKSKSYKLNTN